jgi:hypothetical protein
VLAQSLPTADNCGQFFSLPAASEQNAPTLWRAAPQQNIDAQGFPLESRDQVGHAKG